MIILSTIRGLRSRTEKTSRNSKSIQSSHYLSLHALPSRCSINWNQTTFAWKNYLYNRRIWPIESSINPMFYKESPESYMKLPKVFLSTSGWRLHSCSWSMAIGWPIQLLGHEVVLNHSTQGSQTSITLTQVFELHSVCTSVRTSSISLQAVPADYAD